MLTSLRNGEMLQAAEAGNRLEIHEGVLREKPSTSFDHQDKAFELGYQIRVQIDPLRYRVRVLGGHVRRGDVSYYIPDVFVLPVEMGEPFRGRADVIEIYADPLPLVVEIWSRSTSGYDAEEKLPEYRRRGDTEIWLLNPFARTLRRWVRGADGEYAEEAAAGGTVALVGLPGVTVDLDALFG